MLESRMHQVSDQYSRDFNGKARVVYHGSQAPKETYITDTGHPSFKSTMNFEKHLENDLNTIEKKFERDYYIDPRIQELQKNAESAYVHWKREQERVREEQMREKTIRESLARVKNEKEQLHRSIKGQETYPERGSNNDYKSPSSGASSSNHLNAGIESYKGKETLDTERDAEEDVNYRETVKHHKNSFKDTSADFMQTLKANNNNFKDTSSGLTRTIKSGTEDFNLHQLAMKTSSPWKNFHYHDEPVNYTDVDVEKLEHASKHCAACESKYKLILNMVNPYKEKQRITDETIRKVLISLKALYMAKKFEEAEELVTNTLADGFKHADIYYMAGEVKRALKRDKEAEACYIQALTFQVHSPYVYQSLGLTYVNLNNHKRAIPLLKHFTEKIVSDTANFELGKCLAVCKSYLEATVYFGKAIQINPKVGDYYLHRGDSYEALEFMKLAIDDYRTFRKLTPNYQEIFAENIRELQRMGKYEEANSYKTYLKKIAV